MRSFRSHELHTTARVRWIDLAQGRLRRFAPSRATAAPVEWRAGTLMRVAGPRVAPPLDTCMKGGIGLPSGRPRASSAYRRRAVGPPPPEQPCLSRTILGRLVGSGRAAFRAFRRTTGRSRSPCGGGSGPDDRATAAVMLPRRAVSDRIPAARGKGPERLVPPDRIELSTSPLPRECSTTELRRRNGDAGTVPTAPPTKRADPATRGVAVQGDRQAVDRENTPRRGGPASPNADPSPLVFRLRRRGQRPAFASPSSFMSVAFALGDVPSFLDDVLLLLASSASCYVCYAPTTVT